MKVRMNLLVSMLAALAASGAAKAAILDAPADETNPQDAKRIIVKLDGDVAGQAIPVMVTGDVDQVMLHDVLLDTKGGNAPRQIVVRAETVGSAQDIEPGGPWIGVQFGPVPKPLASHLQLSEGQGQMVLNVLKDSPADVSGIQQYDVITAIDGVETSKDMGGFLDQIRESGYPVIVHPTMYRANGETENLSFETASKLRQAGISFALQSGFEGYVPKTRVLLFEAGLSAANGQSFDDALRSVTIDAARIIGVDSRVGSLEPGKDGDVALYDGDPFEYTTHCIGVVIEGQVVSEEVR